MAHIKWLDNKNKIENLQSPLNTFAKIEGNVKKIIIALHGFGDNAVNFSQLAKEFNLTDVLWLFIEGPTKVPMSSEGCQWFPLFADPRKELSAAANAIFELIDNIINVTSLNTTDIFLLGFSQGAGMALYYAIIAKYQLAGVISFSGMMLCHGEIMPLLNQLKTPIFLAHGLQDQVIFPITFFETKNLLSLSTNIKIYSKTYNMAHQIIQEEINDSKKFIGECKN